MSQNEPRIRVVMALALLAFAILAGSAIAFARFVWWTEPREAREARQALADGRYDDAGDALSRWPRGISDSPEAHLLKGRIAVAMNRLAEAENELKRARTVGLPRDELALLHALIASKAGRHVEAEPTLREAFDRSRVPDRQVDEALAKAYLETYDLTRASMVLDRWTRDFPADPKPYLWQAEVHSRTGVDQRLVESDYRGALRCDPSLARARLGLAEELRRMHRNAEALAEYNAYLAAEPDDAVAQLGAGRNLVELGDEAAATDHLNRALALDGKTAEPLKELADLAIHSSEWAKTLALLDRAIALDPYDVTTRHSRGLALMRLGRTDEAQAEQAVAARLRKELDRLHEARSRLIAAPNDRKSQLEITRWLFDHAHEREGGRWAEKILAEWPDDPEASRLLADYHQRRGETGIANFYRLHAANGPDRTSVGKEGNKR
jgi:tetratricopeptide (TPR) repeat protein